MGIINRCIQDIIKYWNECWKYAVLIAGVICFAAIIIRLYRKKSGAEIESVKSFMYKLLFLLCDSIYLTYSFYITFGMRYVGERQEVQWIPFADVWNNPWEIPLLIENILLFIPFGLLAPFTSYRFRSKKVILIGTVITSLCIEELQYVFRCGKTEVDDVILNSIGGMIGYGLFSILWNKKERIKEGNLNTKIVKDGK